MNGIANYARAAGFTLVEVLVAVLVLSIGLLGLAGLQMRGLSNNHNAYLRSIATNLAYDMAERMRANPGELTAGNYDNKSMTCSSGCSQAALDLKDWSDALAQLPSGGGVVCIDSTPDDGTSGAPACDAVGSVYAVKLWWSERESGPQSATKRFVTSFQP